jgi:hypothetical protein
MVILILFSFIAGAIILDWIFNQTLNEKKLKTVHQKKNELSTKRGLNPETI